MTPVVLQRDHAGVDAPSPQVTRQTVQKMCEHIRNSVGDPVVTNWTRSAIAAAKGLQGRGAQTSVAGAWWWWIKTHVKFLHHDPQIKKLLNESGQYQLLIEPKVLVRMQRPEGDCANYTMLACAGLCSMGLDCRIVTIACDHETPGRYSHVCAEVYLPDAKMWATFDASHGTALGWEVPTYDQYRRTSWDLAGNVVSDVTVPEEQRARARGGMGSIAGPGVPAIALRILNWLSGELIPAVPNWALVAGGVGLLALFRGGRD